MKIIREPEYYFYNGGFTYAHFRGPWEFCFNARRNNFKIGADWDFYKWKLQDLTIYLGFFSFDWTRIM